MPQGKFTTSSFQRSSIRFIQYIPAFFAYSHISKYNNDRQRQVALIKVINYQEMLMWLDTVSQTFRARALTQ